MKMLRGILVVLMSALVLQTGTKVALVHHCCAVSKSFPGNADAYVSGGCACCGGHPVEADCCRLSCHGITYVRPTAPVEMQARLLLPVGKCLVSAARWRFSLPVVVRHVRFAMDSPPLLLGGRGRLALFSVLVI